jgi:hypothetical protein
MWLPATQGPDSKTSQGCTLRSRRRMAPGYGIKGRRAAPRAPPRRASDDAGHDSPDRPTAASGGRPRLMGPFHEARGGAPGWGIPAGIPESGTWDTKSWVPRRTWKPENVKILRFIADQVESPAPHEGAGRARENDARLRIAGPRAVAPRSSRGDPGACGATRSHTADQGRRGEPRRGTPSFPRAFPVKTCGMDPGPGGPGEAGGAGRGVPGGGAALSRSWAAGGDKPASRGPAESAKIEPASGLGAAAGVARGACG